MTPDTQTNTGKLHYLGVDEAKNYLNGLASAIEAYDLELSIKAQNDDLIKAEAKYKNLVNESEDLEKKRIAIDKKIADNKSDQQQQLKEIENQKQKLTQWVGQRKS
jgi:seryl-tRNA synthetase